jgi:hypothetical protein
MAKHRTHSIEFKRQVAQEFLAGEPATLHAETHPACHRSTFSRFGASDKPGAVHVHGSQHALSGCDLAHSQRTKQSVHLQDVRR